MVGIQIGKEQEERKREEEGLKFRSSTILAISDSEILPFQDGAKRATTSVEEPKKKDE